MHISSGKPYLSRAQIYNFTWRDTNWVFSTTPHSPTHYMRNAAPKSWLRAWAYTTISCSSFVLSSVFPSKLWFGLSRLIGVHRICWIGAVARVLSSTGIYIFELFFENILCFFSVSVFPSQCNFPPYEFHSLAEAINLMVSLSSVSFSEPPQPTPPWPHGIWFCT